ncbi:MULTISPECIES: glycosyltransferase WbsX family protein [unclassified Microbacterium]|uniref:glycosyltransferase WbsX family protein n=1 Tax=unclassified Microbacterium TaxID=2609290 RepID=UPI001AD36002|nr:glycoside hydrolase family 99-like domain-containing protein [Microbacterium sp.]MBN9157273.1 glycoside hydrolase family 99-like domain-containing protein [Microbacterium sp.]MBS1896457.1 glycoside hydrolase family 99-like domain-containing protein [Actinomycetota bacterium]
MSQQLYPEALRDLRSPRRDGTLFPKSWRAQSRQADVALVWLNGRRPDDQQTYLTEQGFTCDVLDLTSGAAGQDELSFASPRNWNAAQRVLAGANAGLFDPYRTVVLADRQHVTASGLGHAMAALRDPRVGVVAESRSLPSSSARKWAARRFRERQWEIPSDEVDGPGTLDFVCRAFLLQGLRGLRASVHHLDAHDHRARLTALIGLLAHEAAAGTASMAPERPADVESRPLSPRFVPFYLPQFHPTDENDRWWGRGFTEWTNVAAAVPNFEGHYQPKLPSDLGFYDLRLDSVREEQTALAAGAGIDSFMYYHYWFAGERLLADPLKALLQSDLAQPFCVMWANEDWTRSWDGNPAEILMGQRYDEVSADGFIDDLMPYLRDGRYISVGGKKVLAVYRPDSVPGFPDVVMRWRESALEHGLELMILGVEYGTISPASRSALDGTMAFPPHNRKYVRANGAGLRLDRGFRGALFSYRGLVEADIANLDRHRDDQFPGVMVGWDNTPRRQSGAHTWLGANPYTFRRWLLAAAESVASRPREHRLVFVNAWNEWAEGAVLEPSVEFGHSYLGVLRDLAEG